VAARRACSWPAATALTHRTRCAESSYVARHVPTCGDLSGAHAVRWDAVVAAHRPAGGAHARLAAADAASPPPTTLRPKDFASSLINLWLQCTYSPWRQSGRTINKLRCTSSEGSADRRTEHIQFATREAAIEILLSGHSKPTPEFAKHR
jgi:hypothetical protein